MTSMMVGNMDSGSGSSDKKETKKDGEVKVMQMMTNMFSTMDSNDLKSLKNIWTAVKAESKIIPVPLNILIIFHQESIGRTRMVPFAR